MTETDKIAAPARDSLRIGVVIERYQLDHPWQDHAWRVGGLIVEGGPAGDWRFLGEDGGVRRYYAGTLPLQVYSGETAGYLENLMSRQPVVYVVLRRGVDDREVAPLLLTLCPSEAQSYHDNGDDIVEPVPMPPAIAAWASAFVSRHHVERAFVKRQQKPKRPGERR